MRNECGVHRWRLIWILFLIFFVFTFALVVVIILFYFYGSNISKFHGDEAIVARPFGLRSRNETTSERIGFAVAAVVVNCPI